MPPSRTSHSGAVTKPARSERTHEENQERAYIAASRRSDRSLEARIESARRASEIHKKRTGRGLRVTEQDVINEEMYEEEEDDLPAHYRRLRQNLYAQGLVMNPGWEAASMLNVYMREAVLNGRLSNQMPGGYPHQPFFAYQHPGQPATSPYQQQQQQQASMSQPSPTAAYRQQPYPMPPRAQQHQRSASIATAQDAAHYPHLISPVTPTGVTEEQRRMSMPSTPQVPNTPQIRPQVSRASSNQDSNSSTVPSPQFQQPDLVQQQQQQQQQEVYQGQQYPLQPSFFDPLSQSFSISPLTTALPPEHQQILGTALSPTDASTPYLMNGSQHIPQPFTYSYNPNGKPLSLQHPTTSGMDQTLAANPLGITTLESAAAAAGGASKQTTAEPFDDVSPAWTTFADTPGLDGGGGGGGDFFSFCAANNPTNLSLTIPGGAENGTLTPGYGMNDFVDFEPVETGSA